MQEAKINIEGDELSQGVSMLQSDYHMDYRKYCFEIVNEQSRDEWERLLGFKILSKYVYLTHEKYTEFMPLIHTIPFIYHKEN